MSLPTLPEPTCLTYSDVDCTEVATRFYTEKQMQAYGQQCRAAGLEEAAKVCDERANGENDAQYCADRIRSLK